MYQKEGAAFLTLNRNKHWCSFFTVYYKHLHVTLRCIAILLAAFATVSIYRVSYFVIAAMAANVIHQALAPVALGMTKITIFIRNM